MIILDFVLLILAVTIFTLGCFVYFKNTASSLNKYFFIYCLSGSYTAFIQFMCFSANDYNAAYRWLKFGSLWPFMFVFLFHLLLIFVKEERKTNKIFLYLLIYLPAGCFSALNYFTTVPVKTNFGNYEMNTNSEVGILLGVWISIVSLIMLFYCIRFHFQTADRLKRKQAKYIFISLIIRIHIAHCYLNHFIIKI